MVEKPSLVHSKFTAVCAVLIAVHSPPGMGAMPDPDALGPQHASAQVRVAAADTPPPDKAKDAGRACFASLKALFRNAALLFEGADILRRRGEIYFLRIRTLKNDSSGSFLRTTYVCEATQRGEAWSVLKVDLPR